MMERRFIKSGVDGLDDLLGGGILEGSIITVSGPTGSGKSTLACQFICNGSEQSGESGVYIAIEESRRDFLFHMGGFRFDIERLEKEGKFVFLDYPVHEVDQIINQSNAIYEIIHNTGARRVVIDSIMPIALFFRDDDDRKKGFLKFIENLRKWNVTIMIVSEDFKMSETQGSPTSQFGIESFTDGWIKLFYRYDEGSMERKRYIEVIKMKGSAHSSRSVPMTLSPMGISVSPDTRRMPLPEKPAAPQPTAKPAAAAVEKRPAPPTEEEIDMIVEKAFMQEPKPSPPPAGSRPPPERKALQKPAPRQPAKPEAAKPATAPPVLTRRLAGPGLMAPAPKSKPPPPAAAKPPPPAAKAPAKAKPAAAKPAAKEKAPQRKPAAPQGKAPRPAPAKMSDSIAQRIAEAKKRIMKGEK